jgi:hypothetical protein
MTNERMEQTDRSFDRFYSDVERNTWAGGNILRGEIPRMVAVTALPTATAERRFQLLTLIGGTGVADTPYVCIKNAADTYEWLEVGGGFESGDNLIVGDLTVEGVFAHEGLTLGVLGVGPETQQTVTGSRSGATVTVLADTLIALDRNGYIVDGTSA